MAIFRIESLVYGVEDLGAGIRYFEDWGLPLAERGAGGADFRLPSGQSIRLLQASDKSLPESAQPGSTLREITWGVDSARSLKAIAAELSRDRPDGIVVGTTLAAHMPEIIAFAARERLPAIYPFAPAVREGGLMAYSPNWLPQSRRNAEIVDRILKGAQPRDIPVEQPVRYSLGINLRTARAMSLTIPRAVLLRATTVIE